MRLLLFIVSFLLIAPIYGQNKETDDNSVDKTELEKDSKADSIVIQSKKEVKSRSVEKKVLKSKSQSYDLEEAAEAEEPTPGIQSAQSYKVVESNFNLNKVESSNQRTQRSPSISQQIEMDNAVKYFESNSPNSFEHNFFYYVSGNYDVSRQDFLNEAERLRPNNSDVQIQKAALFMIKGDTKNSVVYIEKLIKVERLTASAINYGKDVLISTPMNGTLITHGFDDTYSVWYAQKQLGIRTDVKLISLDFMQSDFYRNELKRKGYQLPNSGVVDVQFFNSFCSLNKTKGLSASLTLPKEYLSGMLSELYVTGLVFEYHNGSFSNFSRNDDLWRNKLNKELINQANDEKGKQLSSNYLPMLLQLRKVYHEKGDSRNVTLIDADIDKVGVQCRKYDKVQQLKGAY